MLTDPWFYAAAVPAVLLTGLSKGGFGGAFGFAAVPLLALVISPVQAAGLMLPILLIMDAVSVWAYRSTFDRGVVLSLLPGGMVGTAVGWATASLVSDDAVRLIVGAIALAFLIRYGLQERRRALAKRTPEGVPPIRKPNGAAAGFWGSLAGYTSFVAHAGGPPFQTYVVPLRLPPVLYAGTSAIYFAILNSVKVVPYAALGQFTAETMTAVAILSPAAIGATLVGVRLVRLINETAFYRLLAVSIFLIAIKLIIDGVSGLAAN
ncbi:sulfite exporter TauE/SafE family protein [Chthonobacter rhizosphaerae]|uniref:sulfite exporter TauE/SafE family protein n=1 Tax=Chthonobacter rhizosphaerae TaxID=2735553 RepID=UPI0015EF8691|nr:sulfite exporter TauE/SafE family protein [Chthonobacter rhizosphaerae]